MSTLEAQLSEAAQKNNALIKENEALRTKVKLLEKEVSTNDNTCNHNSEDNMCIACMAYIFTAPMNYYYYITFIIFATPSKTVYSRFY